MRNYAETLDYLFSRLPVFQHIGKAAYKADLNNTHALMDVLNHPELGLTCIHVAGTNGKGSVSSTLASIFQEHGFKTGLYTSPHLKDFRERIRINGNMISEDAVIAFTEKMQAFIEDVKPSFFELTVGMAFEYFREQAVDIAIIEVGMGGRLDSTNVITPELSVITNIGLDHMEFLGDTVEKIAVEKAGIIKSNIPVVIGEASDSVLGVFTAMAKEKGSPFYLAKTADAQWVQHFPLKGNYQQKNLATVAKCLKVLEETGKYRFDPYKTILGLKHVQQNTGLRGRWDILQETPLVIADTAHNEHGLRETMKQLVSLQKARIHMVIGVVNDKDLGKMFPLLPKDAIYYYCKPNVIRGLDAEILGDHATAFGFTGSVYSSVSTALEAAKSACAKDEVIYVGGSTFVVAEVVS